MQVGRPRHTTIEPERWPRRDGRRRRRRKAPLLYCGRCSATLPEPSDRCGACGKPAFNLDSDFAPWLARH
jgi:hypothetical protein